MNQLEAKSIQPNQPHLTYLSFKDQSDILNKLKQVRQQATIKEKLFVEHGEKFSFLVLFTSNLMFHRCCLKSFNLLKFGKGRVTTFIYGLNGPALGAVAHEIYVRHKLFDHFRPENVRAYALNSLLVHQYGLLMSFVLSAGVTFSVASRSGIIAVPDHFLKSGNRQIAFRYAVSKMSKYSKTLITTCLMSSIVMSVLGAAEYEQSRKLLAKIDRKTVSYNENSLM